MAEEGEVERVRLLAVSLAGDDVPLLVSRLCNGGEKGQVDGAAAEGWADGRQHSRQGGAPSRGRNPIFYPYQFAAWNWKTCKVKGAFQFPQHEGESKESTRNVPCRRARKGGKGAACTVVLQYYTFQTLSWPEFERRRGFLTEA